MKLRDYQLDAMNKIIENFKDQKEVVLASAPNSGKTFIATEFIKNNPESTFLILTHGTIVLKEQWRRALDNAGIHFSDKEGESRVTYGIPQGIKNKSVGEVDYLIIDEAHEFSFASMVKDIKSKVKPKRTLYLTGTPSKFIAKGYEPIIIPAIELIQKGFSSDLYIGMVSTKANITDEEYNKDGDVVRSAQKRLEKTVTGDLDELLQAMHIRLCETHMFKGSPKLRKVASWLPTIGKLNKTLIACRSIKQAELVNQYFSRVGVRAILSHSELDVDSANIEAFKNDPEINVLIVVDRGILGFDMPDLVNVVDMTCSRNIDRIYQLYARVMRKSENHPKKYFFKLSTDEHMLLNKFYMEAALHLMMPDFISAYNGKNLNGRQILVRRVEQKTEGNGDKVGSNKREFRSVPIDGFFKDYVEAGKMLIDIHNKIGQEANEYAYTTFLDIKRDFGRNVPSGYWTLEKCKESALKFKTRSEWAIADKSAYAIAQRNNWINECCLHMEILKGYWTLTRCIESASKYKTFKEWEKSEPGAYSSAKRNKWTKICGPHMYHRNFTLEKCRESAAKYKTRIDWIKSEESAYQAARRRGWLEECTTHMQLNLRKLDIETCKESSSKYQTRSEWQNNDSSAYRAACENRWLEECCAHMIRKNKQVGYWTLQRCKQSSIKFTSKMEWRKKESASYSAAYVNGWLEECCTHMNEIRKPKGYWTLKVCKSSALKYQTIQEWKSNESAAYAAAHNHNWIDKCTAHMTCGKTKWTFETCQKDALKYNSRSEWAVRSGSAYSVARKNNWLDKFF